jgi:hypothetical protein
VQTHELSDPAKPHPLQDLQRIPLAEIISRNLLLRLRENRDLVLGGIVIFVDHLLGFCLSQDRLEPVIDRKARRRGHPQANGLWEPKNPSFRVLFTTWLGALANSQLEGLDTFVGEVTDERPVTFAHYTGQEDIEAAALN